MTSPGVRLGTTNRLTRGFISLLGAGAIVWGAFVLPLFWQQVAPQSVATKLLDDRSFKLQSLLDAAQQAERSAQRSFCAPTTLRSLFVLRLFILNNAIAGSNQVLVQSYTPMLDHAARSVLSCAPTDSLAWLTLFWLDAGRHGLDNRNTNYFRQSYAMAPNEASIALWRIRLAFLLFDRLPSDLSTLAVGDFIKLVNTGWFFSQTAGVFKDASPAAQSRIVEQLRTVNLINRQAFARALYDEDVDVEIPGVERPGARPWR